MIIIDNKVGHNVHVITSIDSQTEKVTVLIIGCLNGILIKMLSDLRLISQWSKPDFLPFKLYYWILCINVRIIRLFHRIIFAHCNVKQVIYACAL